MEIDFFFLKTAFCLDARDEQVMAYVDFVQEPIMAGVQELDTHNHIYGHLEMVAWVFANILLRDVDLCAKRQCHGHTN